MMKTYDVIVVGAGAAGLMAAGEAASCGAKTLLLEKMDQPGRKIYISGKFRCNITNTAPIPEFINHFGKDGRFLRQAFHQFFSDDLLTFFHQKGVATIEERGGRIFPASGQSKDVVDALVNWGKNQGVTLNIYTPVVKLISENDQILGVETPKTAYQARNVIITTGGASYPGTGSTGDGYNLAALAGHTIIPVRPALVPLLTDGDTAQRLQGLSLRNVSVSIWVNQKKIDQAFGEMLFTHFGVSGPIILSMSKIVVDALADGEKVMLSLDLKPALDDKKLDARILRDFNQHGKQHFQTFLNDLLPQN